MGIHEAAAVAGCTEEDNVDTINFAVESGVNNMEEFMWPKEEIEEQCIDLPVVDVEKLRKAGGGELEKLLNDVVMGSQESCGFFRVVNHGLSSELLRKLEEQMLRLFLLPVEVKRNVSLLPKSDIGFFSGADPHLYKNLLWQESLMLYCDPHCVDEYTKKFWPQAGGEEFNSTMKEYLRASYDLCLELLHFLTAALNLDSSKYIPQCSLTNSFVRLNYYPVCKRPADTLGVPAHSDVSILTVLFEDQVGGLQVQKDNKWFAIKPQPNTLLLNMGDMLQVWSNNVYTSGVHRAVVNSEKRRVSAALFLNPEAKSMIEPATELIDRDHPAKFRRFSFEEYLASFYEGELLEIAKSRLKFIQLGD